MNNKKNVDPNIGFLKSFEDVLSTYSKALVSQRIKAGMKRRRVKNNV